MRPLRCTARNAMEDSRTTKTTVTIVDLVPVRRANIDSELGTKDHEVVEKRPRSSQLLLEVHIKNAICW